MEAIVKMYSSDIVHAHIFKGRKDYKFAEMIGQKPLIAMLSLNLVKYPCIALER